MGVPELDQLRFASDATMAAIWGGACLLLAVFAFWGDHRRARRRALDSIGWMPWTQLFFTALLAGCTLIMLALQGWLAGK
jgi:hypothetical protein